jgi:hypothetical protein
MTKRNETVYSDGQGKDLLRDQGNDTFYLPLALADAATLRALGAAISDALNVAPENIDPSGSLAKPQGAPSPAHAIIPLHSN